MNDDTGYDAMITGLIHSIYVSKRGTEVNILPDTGPPKDSAYYTCRLDRNVSHLPAMLDLAKTAMLHKLTVTLLGFGDDRDDTLVFDELRILSKK